MMRRLVVASATVMVMVGLLAPGGAVAQSADPTTTSSTVADPTTTSSTPAVDEEVPEESGEASSTTTVVDDEEAETSTTAVDEEVPEESGEDASSTTVVDDGAVTSTTAVDDESATSTTAAGSEGLQAGSGPVYEITGAWVNPPPDISRGEPVVAEWRVNVNDSAEPPSNAPVDDVVVDFTLDKAFFDELPDLCLVDDVDPPSAISPDGTTLSCNFGTVNMGTALVVQTPVVADGETGDEVVHDGTIDGQTVELPPIPIVNPFVMDMQWTGVSNLRGVWDDVSNPGFVDVDLQWSLRLGQGSDIGPPQVTYRLNVGAQGVPAGDIEVGFHFRTGEEGCSRFDAGRADGHPWSRTNIPIEDERNTSFVDTCTLTEVSPGVFDLTLSGINYDLLNVPTQDSFAVDLPTNWNYIASGSVWFRVFTDTAGSLTLDSNEPTYTAPTGQTFTDLAGNNTSNKPYTLPGSWSASYQRNFTGNGGQVWDDTYRTSPGTTVRSRTANRFATHNPPSGATTFGNCVVFDYQFVRWDPNVPPIVSVVHNDRSRENLDPPPGQIEYYVGNDPAVTPGSGGYDPDQFDCGVDPGNWTANPADPSQVKAVRHLYPFSTYADEDALAMRLFAHSRINDDVAVGQDIWMVGSVLGQNGWVGPDQDRNAITDTPGARYPHTNGRRDILRIVTATPFIQKEAAQATVTPGVPADFTLIYSATGTGSIPDTVDGYEIVDTLPVGMTYEEGSADPEPVVTMNGGQQVLTWTLDGVATNVEHELTYQATADSSVEPGTVLTNTAQSSLEGASSEPVEESVTTTTNGYTIILKTADVDFIPNQAGDGVGTGSWTVSLESFDPLPQAFTDTIDILPYNGDGRGTSFAGTYSLDEVVVPDGATLYYTDADPGSLSDDPADPSNGTPGDVTGNTVGWTTDRPENPTAIRVIGGELLPGEEISFQVVITTNGAQMGDVYVNRAQARAEHTELVMRTSAPLVVTAYDVVKVSDPPSGSTVDPGQVVDYTITVTQQGPVPAGALLTDDISAVLDDATFNDDVATDLGTVVFDEEAQTLSWEGIIPVGGVATITYSVTVKDIDGLEADGDTEMVNVVSSPGCRLPDDCTTIQWPGWYEYSKTSVPEPGARVQVGEVVTYQVEITQRGEGAIEAASVTDDLSAVLDDATWNNDVQVPVGDASLDGTTLSWSGDLAVGDVVPLTYSVTVVDGGDFELENVVTNGDPNLSRCVPAPDENPDCETNHDLGDYEVVKSSDPETGSDVDEGDVVTYTLTISHVGRAFIADAWVDDDLTEVLDDATYNNDAQASEGQTSYTQPTLAWDGELGPGDVVTMTYTVTVDKQGDRELTNVIVAGGGQCLSATAAQDGTPGCQTAHVLSAAAIVTTGASSMPVVLVGMILLVAGAAVSVALGLWRRVTGPTT